MIGIRNIDLNFLKLFYLQIESIFHPGKFFPRSRREQLDDSTFKLLNSASKSLFLK